MPWCLEDFLLAQTTQDAETLGKVPVPDKQFRPTARRSLRGSEVLTPTESRQVRETDVAIEGMRSRADLERGVLTPQEDEPEGRVALLDVPLLYAV